MQSAVPVLILLLFAGACAGEPPSGRRVSARARLPAGQADRVGESSVPVLLPKGISLDRARLTVERAYTALSVPTDGLTVSLHSTRMAHHYAGIAPSPGNRVLRGVPGHVTQNEGIWTAAWVAGDVAHALDVECAQAGDPRCADDKALLQLVEELDEAGP